MNVLLQGAGFIDSSSHHSFRFVDGPCNSPLGLGPTDTSEWISKVLDRRLEEVLASTSASVYNQPRTLDGATIRFLNAPTICQYSANLAD